MVNEAKDAKGGKGEGVNPRSRKGQMCTVSQCRLLFTFKDSLLENALG